MQQLKPVQFDILQEIINMGMGEAASSLSTLVRAKISIKTPELEILAANEVNDYFTAQFPDLGIHVSQTFTGDMAGQSLLCYSRQSSCSLLEVLTGENVQTLNFSNQQIAILEEIGNIILGSCLTVIANVIDDVFKFEIPNVGVGVSDYLSTLFSEFSDFEKALIVKTEMTAKDKNISGHIIILLGFNKLLAIIEQLEKRMNVA